MRLSEPDFIQRLRAIATHPAARGLRDDAAVLEFGSEHLVLTHDMIVEGVHFLPADPPSDVAWKLLAVNLSDLAAKGARPVGVMLGFPLGDSDWDTGFVDGLDAVLQAFDTPLLGGDTVSVPAGSPRHLGLTAIGSAGTRPPARSGAAVGDILWVTGTIGDAGAGLRIARGEMTGPEGLAARYRRPTPRLAAGQALAPLVTAMMDVSDGLLLDAARLAEASNTGIDIALGDVPLSAHLVRCLGDSRDARLAAATAGDDYELLFTAPEAQAAAILSLAGTLGLPISRIGRVTEAAGLRLHDRDGPVPLPASLGYQHG